MTLFKFVVFRFFQLFQRLIHFFDPTLSAPFGEVLRYSSIRVLQRPFVSLIALQPGHPNRGSELVNVLLGDSLPLDSCSLKRQRRDRNGSLELLACQLSTFQLSFSTVLQSHCG